MLDEYGQTALLIAASNGHTTAVKLLLRHGAAAVHTAAHGGVTAASAAAAHGFAEVLHALTEAGADLGTCGSEGLAPLDYVMRRAQAAGLCGGGGGGEGGGGGADAAAAAGGGGADVGADGAANGELAGVGPEGRLRRGLGQAGHAAVAALALPRAVGAPPAELVRLVPSDADHPGAGACYIDGGVPEAGLVALEALFHRLPIHPRTKCSQAMSDRSYFCDAEGWISKLLADAYEAGRASALSAGEDARMPCEGEAVVQMRFLIYAEAGGGLPPHTDLSRTRRRDGRLSRCTFLLYITDCDVGGETVLLDRVRPQPCTPLAAVTPRRGRLLLFPHMCPHRADEVVAEGLPKTLLRGEMI